MNDEQKPLITVPPITIDGHAPSMTNPSANGARYETNAATLDSTFEVNFDKQFNGALLQLMLNHTQEKATVTCGDTQRAVDYEGALKALKENGSPAGQEAAEAFALKACNALPEGGLRQLPPDKGPQI